ncbi:MAG: hypothetical protein Fur0037_09360 [Planctomycetota bacterium]
MTAPLMPLGSPCLPAGAAVALTAMLSAFAPAQGQQPAIRGPNDVTFELLASAPYGHLVQMEQTRRFLTPAGGFVDVRERVTVDGDGTRTSPFRLDYLGVVGVAPNSPEDQKWAATYGKYASLFYEHGSFRVHDATLAAANYRIHTFGTTTIVGRTCWRGVVYPLRLDKSIWLVDLDSETGIPLHVAEFDSGARLIGELTVTRFAVAAQVQRLGGNWAWSPRMRITPVDPQADTGSLFGPSVHVVSADTSRLMPDYSKLRSHVAENSFNGDRSLVDIYGDGIDEFFVVQTPGRPDPFASGPNALISTKTGATKRPDTIAYYDDAALRVYEFHQHGVSFQIAGRGSLARLDQFSRQVYKQAYAGR